MAYIDEAFAGGTLIRIFQEKQRSLTRMMEEENGHFNVVHSRSKFDKVVASLQGPFDTSTGQDVNSVFNVYRKTSKYYYAMLGMNDFDEVQISPDLLVKENNGNIVHVGPAQYIIHIHDDSRTPLYG